MDAWTNRGLQIPGLRTEVPAHLSHSLFDDAFRRASPTRMKHADGAALGINENDGETIGGLNAEQQTRRCRDQAIAGKLRFRLRVDESDDVRMNLPQRDQRPRLCPRTKLAQKSSAVALDCGFGVILCES